jgi:hypothetical protein
MSLLANDNLHRARQRISSPDTRRREASGRAKEDKDDFDSPADISPQYQAFMKPIQDLILQQNAGFCCRSLPEVYRESTGRQAELIPEICPNSLALETSGLPEVCRETSTGTAGVYRSPQNIWDS